MGEALGSMTRPDDAMWRAAFKLLDVPAALTEGSGGGIRVVVANAMFRELLPDSEAGRRDVLSAAEGRRDRNPFPGQPGWLLHAKPVGDGLTLWQAQRETAKTVTDGVADWVASATLGDMAILFFDSDDRLRAYNAAIRHYFPPCAGFPALGETFERQLDAIIESYGFSPPAGTAQDWKNDLMAGFHEPGRPRLGLTPSGRWALSTTTRMGDGSSLQLLNDVTAFRERDQQMKLFMRNARGILFSRRDLEKGDLKVWGDSRALELADSRPSGKGAGDQLSWFDLIDERDRDRYVGFMKARRPEDKPYSIEFRFRHPDKDEFRWIREIGWTVVDREGRNYLDAIYFDITENKLASEALKESEKRFRDLTEMASDWYFETDADLRLTYLSGRYESVGGVSPEQFVGRPWAEIVEMRTADLEPADAAAWYDLLAVWRRHEAYRDWQIKFYNANGELKYARISAEPQYDADGAFKGYRGIGRDVTALTQAQNRALKSLERAEQANAAKSAFIANVSHELRTPLNAILGFSAIMSDQLLGPIGNERYRGYAIDIAASGEHLLSLVNDLLDISKVEAGRYTIEDENVDFRAEIERIIHLLGVDIESKELVRAYGEGPYMVRADRRAVRQMLINLIGNAVKYTGDDGRIAIGIGETDRGQPFVEIADNGVGIPQDDLHQVLEPFGRARSEIAAEGTGLGLPLTRRLMELHGGSLLIDSTQGRGTRVRMIFPAERATAVALPDAVTG
jgi:PAS domain S-box-containing protein